MFNIFSGSRYYIHNVVYSATDILYTQPNRKAHGGLFCSVLFVQKYRACKWLNIVNIIQKLSYKK